MPTITLPRMAVSRKAADRLMDAVDVNADGSILIDGRRLSRTTESFSAQFLLRLHDLNATRIEVTGTSTAFVEELRKESKVSGYGITVDGPN